jgi:hypothetical protein
MRLFREACRPPLGSERVRAAEALQPLVLADLLGYPGHIPAVGQAWLSWNNRTIPRLAQAIYDEYAFGRLPILADALEEAGCDDADILAHCRSGGEHVRGCWALDWVLGEG